MVAPVDRRGAFDRGLRQAGTGRIEIRAADAKGVMAPAQRMLDAIAPFIWAQRRAINLEKREVLIAALQQRLIAQVRDHREPHHLGIEALRAREVGDFDSEMVESFEFHSRCSRALARC